MKQQTEREAINARLRATLAAAGYVPGTVEAVEREKWEAKVAAALDPLVEALKRGIAESPFKPEGE